MRMVLILLLGWGAAACGGHEQRENVSEVQEAEIQDEELRLATENFDEVGEVEACSIARPGDCLRLPSLGTKKVSVCGYDMKVPVLTYIACEAGSALLPASCTVGTAATAGTSCATNLAIVATTCAVSVATVSKAAECCIRGGC